MEYLLTLFRYGAPFPANPVRRVLALLQRHVPQFFPARIATEPDRWVAILDAKSFDPSSVPPEYWTQSGRAVRVPIESLRGPLLEVEDYREPGPAPCYLGLHWPEEQLPETDVLSGLLAGLGQALQADRGRVTDEVTLTRRDILDRIERSDTVAPEALYWLNWFGPRAVTALGRPRFDALAGLARVEEREGGLLVRLLDTPLDGDNLAHEAHRVAAEERFGLRALLARA